MANTLTGCILGLLSINILDHRIRFAAALAVGLIPAEGKPDHVILRAIAQQLDGQAADGTDALPRRCRSVDAQNNSCLSRLVYIR